MNYYFINHLKIFLKYFSLYTILLLVTFSCKLKDLKKDFIEKEVELSALTKSKQYSIKSKIGMSSYFNIPVTNNDENILTFLNVILQNNLDSLEIYKNDCNKISLQKNATCVIKIKYKPNYAQQGMARLSLIYSNKFNEKMQNDIFILYSSIQPELIAKNISLSSFPGNEERAQIKVKNDGTDSATIVSNYININPSYLRIISDKCLNIKLQPEEYCVIDISYNPNKVESGDADLKLIYLDSNSSKYEKDLLIFYSSSEPLLYAEDYNLNSPIGKKIEKKFFIKNIGKSKAVLLSSSLFNNRKSLTIVENKCSFGLNLNSGESCSVVLNFNPENIEDAGVSILKINYFSNFGLIKEKLIQINYAAKDALIDMIDSEDISGKNGEMSKIVRITNRGNIHVKVDSFSLNKNYKNVKINYSESSCVEFELVPYNYCTIKLVYTVHKKEIDDTVVDLIFNYVDNNKYTKLFHISNQDDIDDLIEPLRNNPSIVSEVGVRKVISFSLHNKGEISAKINSINLSGDTRFIKIDNTNFNCEGAFLLPKSFCKIEIIYKPLVNVVGKVILNINYIDSNQKIYNRSFDIQVLASWKKNLLLDSNGEVIKYCKNYEFVKSDDHEEYLRNIFIDRNEFLVLTKRGNPSLFEFLPKNASTCSPDLRKNSVNINEILYIKSQKKLVGLFEDNNTLIFEKKSEFKLIKKYNHISGYSIFTLNIEKRKKFVRIGCELNKICGLGNYRTLFSLKPINK